MFRNNNSPAPYWRLIAMLSIIVIGLISTTCTSSDDGGESITRFEETEPFSFDVTIVNQEQFILRGVNGEITITGNAGANSVLVTGIKRVQSSISAQDAIDHLPDLIIDWESLANEISVETNQPQDTPERNFRVDYTITLPKYFQIQVNSINGTATLDSIDNDVTVTMANGEVTLTKILGSASVNLANGKIDADVVLPLQGTIDLGIATGQYINLAIPTNTSADFSATSLFGSINISNLVLTNEVITATSHSGTLGSGQGMIALSTMGDISVLGF